MTSVLTVLGVVGCGGDDDAASKEEFVSSANAICARGDKRIDSIGKADDIDAALRKLENVSAIGAQSVSELKQLDPPRAQERDFEAYLRGVDRALGNLRATKKLFEARDLRGAEREYRNFNRIFAAATAAGRRAGLGRKCIT